MLQIFGITAPIFILIGIGFGMSYISIAAAFSSFFGRKAFATTTGTRFLIGGVFNAAMPPLARSLPRKGLASRSSTRIRAPLT